MISMEVESREKWVCYGERNERLMENVKGHLGTIYLFLEGNLPPSLFGIPSVLTD